MSICEEFRPILSVSKEQVEPLKKILDPNYKPKRGKKFTPFMKPYFLLNAYMQGKKIDPLLEKDLDHILKNSVHILQSLVDITVEIYSYDPRMQT